MNKIAKQGFGRVRDAAWLMGESIEAILTIRKAEEDWIPSSVFGSDTRSAGCPYVGGTAGEGVGGCRHENG